MRTDKYEYFMKAPFSLAERVNQIEHLFTFVLLEVCLNLNFFRSKPY